MIETIELKAAVTEVALKLEEVQKANEEKDKEKGMERLKKENKGLKQQVNILFGSSTWLYLEIVTMMMMK